MSAKVEAATRAREAARLAARTRKPAPKPRKAKVREPKVEYAPMTEDTSGEVDDGG